jgi:hypothetical protein
MQKTIRLCRYLLLAVFVISNAIICSVAVWNFFIAQAINHNLQIDAFLIVLGALSLMFIFVLVLAGLLRRNSFASRVWFECVWVGVFFSLHFSGALALTLMVPSLMCPLGNIQLPGSCASTQILMAFTWVCAVCLFGYFLLVFISAVVYSRTNPRIWNRALRHFSVSDMPDSAAPPLSSLPRKRKSLVSIIAPRPRYAAPPSLYAFSNGFGSEDDQRNMAESSRAPHRTSHRQVPPLPTTPPQRYMVQRARESQAALPVSSLYPQHVRAAMADTATRRMEPLPTLAQWSSSPSPPPPQPLGDWPRLDVLSQPVRGKVRKSSMNVHTKYTTAGKDGSRTVPTSTTVHAKMSMTTTMAAPSVPPLALTVPSRSRPSGPRSHANSRDWSRPPPLDLSKISSYAEKSRRS